MKKYLNFLLILFISSCTRTNVSVNPDYRFPSTNPSKIKIYDRIEPQKPYIAIGRIDMNAWWLSSESSLATKLRNAAAKHGGDAVILTNKYMDFRTCYTGSTTSGTAHQSGNTVYYNEQTSNNTQTIKRKISYGYIIKFRNENELIDKNEFIGKYVQIKSSYSKGKKGYYTNLIIKGVIFNYEDNLITILVLNTSAPNDFEINIVKKYRLDPTNDKMTILQEQLNETTLDFVNEQKKQWEENPEN